VKRAPPCGDSSTATPPLWALTTAATIGEAETERPAMIAGAADEAFNSEARSSGAIPGPSSATTSSAVPSGSGRVLAVTRVPVGV